jgi:very-short-patch-repair endonuclease/predicted transcriptional regulator of viral defense system
VTDFDRRLATVAAQHHSLITLRDVIEAGGDDGYASRRVRSGRWERWAPGVYRVAGAAWSYEAKVLASVLAAGPGAVASHLCAARLLGLGFTKAGPEVTIPRGRRHRPPDVRVHESTDLDLCEVRVVGGVPVTDPDRTALDLGRYLRVPSLTKAVEEARRLELVTWQSLLRTLVAHARQGRHGVTNLREVISTGLERAGITDTDSELVALALLREHGFRPVLHHVVRASDGEVIAEIDIADPARRAGLEIDGTVHLRPEVRAKDDARDHRLRRMGWTIRRVWCELPVLEPARFLAIARELFGRD